MKFLRLTVLVAFIGGLGLFSSCKPKEVIEPSIEEAQLKLLSKTWNLNSATFGPGSDRTSDYTGMTLTLSGTFNSTPGTKYNYSRSSLTVTSPWPSSGTWAFEPNDPANLIIRTEDNLLITYNVTATTLILSFDYTSMGAGYPGRVSSINDTWEFVFTSN